MLATMRSSFVRVRAEATADAVSGYLASHGLASKQVTATSRGAMDATGHEETGWAHDRRVDVYLGE
jgi:outer membrane protein OmpA-like peptidoglycan-associated protein